MSTHPADRPDHPSDRNHTAKAPVARQLPRYNVVLQSDPSVDLMHVVRSLMLLTRFPREESTHKMWQAQHSGQATILQTHLERAELYVEQFAERGLTVRVERVVDPV